MNGLSAGRFQNILKVLKAQRLDCLLLSNGPNVSYATGFLAPDSYLIASANNLTLITDFRYSADFRSKARPHIKIVEAQGGTFRTICEILRKNKLTKAGFESRHLSFAECQALLDISKKKVAWIPLEETLEPLRQIKEAAETEQIRKAIQITEKTYDFLQPLLKPGIRELELAAEIERFIRLQGATSAAFDIIVASGPNSSYPHASISPRIIKEGEPVVIDLGVTYNGYKCDLTRTFFLGKINAIVRKADMIVKEAQQRAIKAIKPNVPINLIDGAARNYISLKGFGKNFGHSLGHGIGLEVHEAPSINKRNRLLLKKGMIFTVEPGIYVPGSFGIRWEDMVLVTDNGAEVLSGNNKH